jgi:hypothetical protein
MAAPSKIWTRRSLNCSIIFSHSVSSSSFSNSFGPYFYKRCSASACVRPCSLLAPRLFVASSTDSLCIVNDEVSSFLIASFIYSVFLSSASLVDDIDTC